MTKYIIDEMEENENLNIMYILNIYFFTLGMIVICPHCKEPVEILEVNCAIFRHAIFRNGIQIPPHSPKEQCDRFIQQGLVYGCAKPFRIFQKSDGEWQAEECDYI